jgi:ADP-sugar diphosphatase
LLGKIFMRGGSLAVLVIFRPIGSHEERWVLMTEQPRIAAGSLSFMEIPIGILDEEGTFRGVAARKIEAETGMIIHDDELVDMRQLAMEGSPNLDTSRSVMYFYPLSSDEFVSLFVWEKHMERLEIEDLKDKLARVGGQGEIVALKLINYEDMWRLATRDAKSMVSWALYESLKRAGKIDENGNVVKSSNTNSR